MTAGKPPADDERLLRLFDEAALPVAPELLGVLGCVKSLGDRPVPAPGADLLAFLAPPDAPDAPDARDAPDRGRLKRLRGPIIGGTLAVSMGLGMSGVAAGPGTFTDDLGSAVHSVLDGPGGAVAGTAPVEPPHRPSPSDLPAIAGSGSGPSSHASNQGGPAGTAGPTGTGAAGVTGRTETDVAGGAGTTGPGRKPPRPSSAGSAGTVADPEGASPDAAPGRPSPAPEAGHQGKSNPGPKPAEPRPSESRSESQPAESQPAQSQPAEMKPTGPKPAGANPGPNPSKSKPVKPQPASPGNGQGTGRDAGPESEAPREGAELARERPAPPALDEPRSEVGPDADRRSRLPTPTGPETGDGLNVGPTAPDPAAPELERELAPSEPGLARGLLPSPSLMPEPGLAEEPSPSASPSPELSSPSPFPSPSPEPVPPSGEELPLRGEDSGVEPGEVQSAVEAGVLDLEAAVHHHR